MQIGFIGLGIMGKHMVKNLLKAGHSVIVYDILPECVQQMLAFGATAADSPCGVASQCNLIITMLPNSPHVKAVVMGEDGILQGARDGTVLIDMSSIAPKASQEIARACGEKGVRMIEAPVSGGEPKAQDGTLSIMVGGSRELFDQYKTLLLQMGASAIWCGEIGAGNTAKLANQVIVAVNLAACAEAFTLARKANVDPQLVFKAIQGGLAGSSVMNAKVPMMIAGNYAPGFKMELHIKDLNNAIETGHEVGAPLPLTALIMEMLQTLRADGLGQMDHAGIAKYYAKVSGQEIGQ